MNANWLKVLEDYFGDYTSEENAALWHDTVSNLGPGKEVSGTVIVHAPFGAWIDIGFGFPALIEAIHIMGLTPDRYVKDDYCPVGTKVDAVIRGVSQQGRQIRLEQTQ